MILCIGEFVTPRLEKIAEENFDKASMNVGVSLTTMVLGLKRAIITSVF